MLSLLPLFFAKTPATGTDSAATGEAATSTDSQGKPAQGGAISDVVQIPKKEYADLLSLKGYHSSFQSTADKKLQEYETKMQALQAELERVKQPSQPSKSALEQILEKTTTDDDEDIFADDKGNFIKQALMAMQSEIDIKLSARDAEIQRLNNELQQSKQESIIASKTLQRKLNIDSAVSAKVLRLMEDYHISRDEAVEFLEAKEKVATAMQDIRQVDDENIGKAYVDDLLDTVIDSVAERKIKLAEHKAKIEQERQEKEAKLNTLLEGDKTPSRTQITLNLSKPDELQAYGLSPTRKGESREDYNYRQLKEDLDRTLAKTTVAGKNRYK